VLKSSVYIKNNRAPRSFEPKENSFKAQMYLKLKLQFGSLDIFPCFYKHCFFFSFVGRCFTLNLHKENMGFHVASF